MKGVYLVATLYVATLGVAALDKLPADILRKCSDVRSPNETLFLPHETDCTKYYNCHMGEKGKPLDCPFMDNNGNRLHFNPRLQVCDWPWSAGCQLFWSSIPSPSFSTPSSPPSSSPIPSTPSSSPTPSTSPSSPLTSPSPSSNSPTPSTPSSTFPTPSSFPTSSIPPSSSPTSSTPPSSSPTPSITPSNSPTSSTPPPSSPTPLTTPSSSPTPSVPSSSSPTPSTTEEKTRPSIPSSWIRCVSDGRLHMIPHKTMCDHYYSCVNGKVNPVPQKCDRNLLFNPMLRVCDYPENVDCNYDTTDAIPRSTITVLPTTSSSTTITSTTSIPSSSSPKSPNTTESISRLTCVSDGRQYLIPHQTMCNSYYTCYNGEVNFTPKKCERHLLFNPILRVCDYPKNVDCNGTIWSTNNVSSTTPSSIIITTTPPTPSPITVPTPVTRPTSPLISPTPNPSVWTCEPNGRYKVPHKTSCYHYFWCVDGKLGDTPLRCPNDLLFNSEIGECDFPENVNCNGATVTVPLPSTSTTTTTTTKPTTTTAKPTTTTTKPTTTTTKRTMTTTKSTTTTTKTTTITTTAATTTTTEAPKKPRTECPPKGSTEIAQIAHYCLCNVYYECVDGDKILQTCPIGMHFDYVREVCDWATIVRCIRPIPIYSLFSNCDTSCAPDGKAFRHESSCTLYYLCHKGEKILKQCIAGLHFNETLQICDYPQNTSCDLTVKSIPTISLDICPPAGSTETVLLPHECICEQYYQCRFDGRKVLRFCPRDLHFDSIRRICTDPVDAVCGCITTTTTTATTTPKLTTAPITITTTVATTTKALEKSRKECSPKGSNEKVRIAHRCGCNMYYECVEGEKILKTCPTGKHFDEMREVCDWAALVKCIRPIPTYDIIINQHDSKCSPEGSVFQHEINCTAYYLCSGGEKILKHCKAGLHFNATIQMCDYPQKIDCDLPAKPIPIISLDVCPPAGSTDKVLLPHECDCSQYYACIKGEKVLRDCPNGLHFDHIRQMCNDPVKVGCGKPIMKWPLNIFAPDSCIDEDGNVPHQSDCKSYYTCSNGRTILKTCPKNLYFNSKLRICDFPQNVNCDATSENMPIIPMPTKCEREENTKIAHETDCNLYYVCEDGVSTLKKCESAKLVFNPVLKVCDFPENYPCANVIQTNNNKVSKPMIHNLDTSTCIGTCPEEDPEYAVLLPNEDCKKFCMCSNGFAWVQPCPEPLYFDSVENVCKRKKDAVCAVRSFNQNHNFVIDAFDEKDSVAPLNARNNDEHGTHDNILSKSQFDNLDPSTCIGTCSEEDPEYAELLPNENCKKFCICSNGFAWVQPCPEPLHFDSIKKICKRKKDAVCAVHSFNRNPSYTIDEDDSIASLSEQSDDEHIKLSNINNYLTKLHFYNLDRYSCFGICPEEEDPEYTVLLPHADCKKFCLCSNGLAYIQLCRESFYFDSLHRVCRHKKHTTCALHPFNRRHAFAIDRTIDEDDSIDFLSEEISNEHEIYDGYWPRHHFYAQDSSSCIGTCFEDDPEYAVLLPHEDCKMFCLCRNGFAYIQQCHEPFYFDSIHKICKHKTRAVCAIREFNRHRDYAIDRIIDEEDDSIEYLSEENSNEHGIYNHWLRPLSVYNLDSSTCIGTCPEEDSEYAVLLPNEDCKKYCLCSNGFAWVQSCPEPLYFDSVKKVCKWKKNAVCAVRSFSQNSDFIVEKGDEKDSVTPPSQTKNNEQGTRNNLWSKLFAYNLDPSTCIGTCPEEDPEYAVLLPNEDCKKFCMCSNGFTWVQSCPEPLYFDSVGKVCKRKKDAVCAVRPFSQVHAVAIDGMTDEDENST